MIDINNLKEGMKVKIISTNYTEKAFGADSRMKSMVGYIFKIRHVYGGYININGFAWSIKDLIIVDTDYKPEIIKSQLFDIENLVL